MQEISKHDILANWNNKDWEGWHSEKYVKARAKNKNTVRDDRYLRENIISKFPVTTETLSLKEINENWHNEDWWKINIGNVINLFDKMYVKKGIKSCSGIYTSWLTRLTQYDITRIAEKAIAEDKGFYWNEAGHSYIHTGKATPEEAQPDFKDKEGQDIELKVCENENSIIYHYFKKLRANYVYTKQHDFHGAKTVLFLTKELPHRLYTVKINDPENLELGEAEIIELDIIKTKNGKILDLNDLPAVPYALLFGLTPAWYKK